MSGSMRWDPLRKAEAAEDESIKFAKTLTRFERWYVEAALWSSTDDDGEPLEETYAFKDIDRATLERMRDDARAFYDDNEHEINSNEELTLAQSERKAAYDFWLTRNGHGAGFWDGSWPEPAASRLTKNAKPFGEFNLYVGGDGRIHGS